jgi:ankyrin repeat protein
MTTDALGRTPLHMAAFYGRTRATELLLASGATIEVRDRIGMTPLHAAVLAGGRHQAFLIASSRSSRRRILPTLVFGSSVRNSTWRGTL